MKMTLPYEADPEMMRNGLEDPAVNVFEHQLNWPRLQLMLPDAARQVLDFGCGPGNFTEALAARYPEAEVIGVDVSEKILPKNLAEHGYSWIVFCTMGCQRAEAGMARQVRADYGQNVVALCGRLPTSSSQSCICS
ncbi:MAG TPA: class I SAM-dependent methyltransferase [Candidatus Saccharimonadales bacterium]|jgi:tRNA G46 methylase TrmB